MTFAGVATVEPDSEAIDQSTEPGSMPESQEPTETAHLNPNTRLDPPPVAALRTEHVWDGFILLSLLEDCASRKSVLLVPHTGDQKNRFNAAMADRNLFMSQAGQPEWAHYCDKCCRVWPGANGELPS